MFKYYLFLLFIILSHFYSAQELTYKDVLKGQNIHLTTSIVSTLSSSAFEGRDIKSPSISKSILYLESLLKSYGIKPYFNSYRVPFNLDDKIIGYNIVGIHRGNLRNKTAIIISANYDNLGLTRVRKDSDTFLTGANDNASGVSALIQIALYFQKIKLNENIIFAFTSGKHEGQVGAGFLADTILNHKFLDVKFAINLEMLGRPMADLRNNLVCIQDSTCNIKDILNSYIGDEFIADASKNEFTDGSDNSAFFNVFNVPSVTLTSFNFNNDKNYLTSCDDFQNIDIDYLHKTTARITFALLSLINNKKAVSFKSGNTSME